MNHTYFQRNLPSELSDLIELAFDLRWNNSPAACSLWRRIDARLWERTENPVLVLQSAYQQRIDEAARDKDLLEELERWRRAVHRYYGHVPEIQKLDPDKELKMVAYFSMEFGLSESLPIYSGGLGMLAGDHLKTASDLGVPMVGIGLLYQQGYFRQIIGDSGEQLEAYPFNDPGSLPIRPVVDVDGHWLRVRIPLPGRTLFLRVWEARVGRVRLLLLDSNEAMNTAWDRGITAQLYDCGKDKRLLQELVLGIGGWRLIERLGLEVDVCHLNEGHAAFAILARAAGFAKKHRVTLRAAFTATRAGNVFTTHTPVDAAFDRFDSAQLVRYTQPFLSEVGLTVQDLLGLGSPQLDVPHAKFNMAWLAIHGCCHVNSVSQLHGEVSRHLFGELFPRWPRNEVPVRAITNGVHIPTWASEHAVKLWRGEDDEQVDWSTNLQQATARIGATSVKELWDFRTRQRKSLMEYVGPRYRQQLESTGTSVPHPDEEFDPDILTIGFARRFATYKRANLLISDPDRLTRLLLDEHRPVQLIVSGKAHPNDGYGKALIQHMTRFLRQPDLRGRAIFLEDYDMVLAQRMVAGVDVWLNTPLRPNEACGTSGMKVLVNGGLHVSVLDGWWDEAIDLDDASLQPGWVVGSREPGSAEALDRRDWDSLFDVLENAVVPEFYERDQDGIPHRWVNRVKESMIRLTPRFSSSRMVRQYIQQAYLPAARAFADRAGDDGRLAGQVLHWRDHVRTRWSHVRIGQVQYSDNGDGQKVAAECWLGDIRPEDVRVHAFADATDDAPPSMVELDHWQPLPGSVHGYMFTGVVPGQRPTTDYTIRIIPHHPSALVPIELHSILWQR